MSRVKNNAYGKAFSKKLCQMREEKKMTLAQLGNESGLDLATVHRIETSNGNVTLSTLLALAKGLKVHPKNLLDFDHSKFL